MIHAVGRAATPERAPRLIDLRWGPQRAPKVTLIGKGVCFDTGGLDIKPAAGMLLMKKDMGGAANVLALARHDHGVETARSPARAHPCCRKCHFRRCLPPRRHPQEPQGADVSRSATPMPRAVSFLPTPCAMPTRSGPISLSTWRPSLAPRAWRLVPICRPFIPTMTASPTNCCGAPSRKRSALADAALDAL